MKIVSNPGPSDSVRRVIAAPPISYEAPEVRDLKKTEILQLELKTSPGVADSARYKKNAQILTDGASCEDVILWKKDLEVILVGLELNKVIDKFNISQRLLKGELLKTFDRSD